MDGFPTDRAVNIYYMASGRRRNIPPEVRRALFIATGRRCTMCRRGLDIEGGTQHIGEMGHIAPSSPDGPRREMARPAEIDGFDNLMLLCPTCHRTIDKEPRLWPGEALLSIKAEHEGWVAVERARPALEEEPEDKHDPLELGESIIAGQRTYQLVGAPRGQWSGDRTAVKHQTFALTMNGDRVWIRRIVSQESGSEVLRWRAGLADEVDLLTEELPGLPRPVAIDMSPGTAVLVTETPSFTAMGDFYDGRGRDPEGVRVLAAGLADLCLGLRTLHARRLAHGDLHLDSIVADESGRLHLRDVGRATTEDGEPAEDVRRLAELVHLVVTGRPPVPLVSAAVLNPAVPESLARALHRALSPDPATRGDIEQFGADLCR